MTFLKTMKIYDVMTEYCKFSGFRGVCYSVVLWVFIPCSITNLSFSTKQKHVQSPWRCKQHILTNWEKISYPTRCENAKDHHMAKYYCRINYIFHRL